MPNLTIDKPNFLNILDQFKYDIPFENSIVDKVIGNMSIQARDYLIETLYYKYVHKGSYYIAIHYLYNEDIHMFANAKMLTSFLQDHNLDLPNEYFDTANDAFYNQLIKKHQLICGYKIYKEESL